MGWVVVSKVPSLLALERNRYPVDEFMSMNSPEEFPVRMTAR